MNQYDLNETLNELASEGVLPDFDIPVMRDIHSLVSVQHNFPQSSNRFENKMVMWVPFLCDEVDD